MELRNGICADTLIEVYYRPSNGDQELAEQICK